MLTRTIQQRSMVSCWVLLLSFVLGPGPLSAAERFTPFKLKTLEGEQKTLPDVLGSKATLVFFFFPTCKYCNEAFPFVQQLYDTYKDRG